MATDAKLARFRKQLEKLEKNKKDPKANPMPAREKIKVRLRCKLCGRPRAVFRKFGVCRICFRSMANDGLIPGVTKASW